MNLPRISIIITSLDQGEYLQQAIQSVLSQGYPDLELIVMDGGSTDGSLEILQKYASSLTYWESVRDRGQAHAINKGLAHCTGELITFLSSDDYYLPGAFVDVAGQYRRHLGAGAVIGGFSFLDGIDGLPGRLILPFIDGPTPADLTLGPPGKYRLHQVSTFYIRTALDAVGRYVREDMKYVMDRELLYRVCRQFPFILSGRTYGVFRRHSGSKSTGEILPFAREFSNLYLLYLSGDPFLDRQRKRMARYRLSRGYIKYSQVVNPARGVLFMVQAGITYPKNLVSRNYWRNYQRVFKHQVQQNDKKNK